MKSYMKKVAAVVAVAGVALSTAACSNSGSNSTVASYKGGKITQQQYYDEMKKSHDYQPCFGTTIRQIRIIKES